MAVDEHLKGELQHLRTLITNVNDSTVRTFARGGYQRVPETRASVDRPERFEDGLLAVERAVINYAEVYSRQWISNQSDERSKQAINDARESLNAQVDALERVLDGAELNGKKRWLLY